MTIQPSTAEALESAFANIRKSNSPMDMEFRDRDRIVRLRSTLVKGELRIDYIQEGIDPYEQWNELNIHAVTNVRYYPDGKAKGRGALLVESDIISTTVDVEEDSDQVCYMWHRDHRV